MLRRIVHDGVDWGGMGGGMEGEGKKGGVGGEGEEGGGSGGGNCSQPVVGSRVVRGGCGCNVAVEHKGCVSESE